MKKSKFIISIFITRLIIIFPLIVNASQINPDDYKSSGPTVEDVEDMYTFGGSIAGIIQIVGTAVSIGTMIIIGIRYVISSADEKAEYKERMFPYFIGAVLLFGASTIVNIAYNMFS